MSSILITGANRGLGLEFARQYAADGYRVFACARKLGEARALHELSSKHASVTVHGLDVSDARSVEALARELRDESLDIVLNNAGWMGPKRQHLGSIDYEGMLQTFAVNTLGPLRVAEALVEQVARSEQKLLIAITSGMGSIADSSGGSYAYRASKAALNMSFHNLALDLKARGIIAFVINPGWVKTDMGGASAPLMPEASISAMRKIFAGMTLADSGTFMDYKGGTYPW